jgi:diacylglycerol kinase family enzyme
MLDEKFRGHTLAGTATAEPPAYALVHEPDTEYALLLYQGGDGTPEELQAL